MNLQEDIQRIKQMIGIISESQEDEEVFPKKRYAYHTTPDIFLKQIQQVGLLLKSESKLSNHPERIYLFLYPKMDKQMTNVLWNATKKEVRDKIKDYYILQIDLSQIPNHKLYMDPASSLSYIAIFTLQPIPSSAIKVIKKIPTSELKQVPSPEEQKRMDDEYEEIVSKFRTTEPNDSPSPWEELSKKMEKLKDKDLNPNLQEDIQRIKQVMNINESSSEKLIKYVYDNGAISTAKLVGGYDDLLKLLGEYSIPREFLIRDIEEFLDKIDNDFSFNEYNETGLPYKEVKDEYHEIVYLGYKGAVIDVWNGFDYQTQKDEYVVPYNELPYKSLQDIVKMISELDPDIFN